METILLDFDGVFNAYGGWRGESYFYPPRPGIDSFLSSLVEAGYTLVVFTARSNLSGVEKWLIDNDLIQYISKVTNTKEPAKLYIDDNAITFQGDFEATLDGVFNFKPYWTESTMRVKSHDIVLKHSGDPDEAFDSDQLAMGIEVEKEHTEDPEISKAIAKAHLAEIPNYYTLLREMESRAMKESNRDRVRTCISLWKRAQDEPEEIDWASLIEEAKKSKWDVFETGRGDQISVETFIKFLKSGDEGTIVDLDSFSDTAYEIAKQMLKDAGYRYDGEDPDKFDELRFAVEEAANHNWDDIFPSPLFVEDPNNQLKEAIDPTDENAESDILPLASKFGFTEKDVRDLVSNMMEPSRIGIALISDSIEDFWDRPKVSGDAVLYAYNGYVGSGFYITSNHSHMIEFQSGKEFADNIDHGSYSMGGIFGSHDWKWR